MDCAARQDAQCLAVQKATASFLSDGGSCADLEGLRGQDLHEFWRRSGIFGRSWFSRENQNLNQFFCKQSPLKSYVLKKKHDRVKCIECMTAWANMQCSHKRCRKCCVKFTAVGTVDVYKVKTHRK